MVHRKGVWVGELQGEGVRLGVLHGEEARRDALRAGVRLGKEVTARVPRGEGVR